MTPFTPAVGVAFALQEGLRMLLEEGLDSVYERHARLARVLQHVEEFEPTELALVATAESGMASANPPADSSELVNAR